MATNFKGWADSWGNSWGSVVTDPNAMRGSATFSIAASLQVAAGDMQGSAAFGISAALQLVEPPSNWSAEYNLLSRRKWYVKRNKQILIFDTAQQADAWADAEQIAEQAIEQAQKTSRRARKRLRERVYKVEGVSPIGTVDIDLLGGLVDRYQITANLPELIAVQDYERVMQIMALALEMQDEEDVEMLLLM